MENIEDSLLEKILIYVYHNDKSLPTGGRFRERAKLINEGNRRLHNYNINNNNNNNPNNNNNNNNHNNNNNNNNNNIYNSAASWKNSNLTCKRWCLLAKKLLRQLNPARAFTQILSSSFSCGGQLSDSTKITLRSDVGKIEFPPTRENYAAQLEMMKELVGQCQSASFGRGAKEVLDPDYRHALVLTPDHFATNFHPFEFDILSGGFFKLHKDTPHGPDHLGSLVVVLPFPHEGGSLVVKQGIKEDKLESKWKIEETPTQVIKWMAFYSNCDHWIEPVTTGYRVTLTYHIFKNDFSSVPTVLNDPIYLTLESMIKCNQIQGGEKYGFFLQNEYSTSELNKAVDNPLLVLKSSDARLFYASVSLGLSTKFRAVFRNFQYWSEDNGASKLLISKRIPTEKTLPSVDERNMNIYMEQTFGTTFIKDGDIQWLSTIPSELRNLAGSASVSTGNEPSTEGFYYQAVIVISKNDPESKQKRKAKKMERPAKRRRNHYSSEDDGEDGFDEDDDEEDEGMENNYIPNINYFPVHFSIQNPVNYFSNENPNLINNNNNVVNDETKILTGFYTYPDGSKANTTFTISIQGYNVIGDCVNEEGSFKILGTFNPSTEHISLNLNEGFTTKFYYSGKFEGKKVLKGTWSDSYPSATSAFNGEFELSSLD